MTNSTKLYTVSRQDGDNREYNLTLAEAAQAILNYDGHTYSIQPEGMGLRLYTSPYAQNSGHYVGEKPTLIYGETESDIFKKVIEVSPLWRSSPMAVNQASYKQDIEEQIAALELHSPEESEEIAWHKAELARL